MHTKLFNCMKELKFRPNEEGICFGIALMALQAILLDDFFTFNERLKKIEQLTIEGLFDKIELLKQRRAELVRQIKQQNKPKETVDAYFTPEEHFLLDLPAFFTGIELYEQAYEHPELFPTKLIKTQDVLQTSDIINPQQLKAKGGIADLNSLIGAYNVDELTVYLDMLKESIQAFDYKHPVTLVLDSGNHTMTVAYDPTTENWILIDARQLPPQYITDASLLAELIISGFSTNGVGIFSTDIFTTEAERDDTTKIINHWKAQIPAEPTMWENVLLSDSENATLLHIAAKKGQTDLINNLLDLNLNVNQMTNDGFTPLYFAIDRNQKVTAELLLTRGANPNLQQKNGCTALHNVVEQGNDELFQLLLTYQSDINLEDDEGNTPLCLAVRQNNIEYVKILLKAGAITNPQHPESISPLDVAISNGNVELAALLLENQADPNLPDEEGFTPLHRAVKEDNAEIVKLLLAAGANPNLKDVDGWVPLHCVMSVNIATVLLEDKRTKSDIVNDDGSTPLDIAREQNKNQDLIDLLQGEAKRNKRKKAGGPLQSASHAQQKRSKQPESSLWNKTDASRGPFAPIKVDNNKQKFQPANIRKRKT